MLPRAADYMNSFSKDCTRLAHSGRFNLRGRIRLPEEEVAEIGGHSIRMGATTMREAGHG
jgi:hypothetical protein